LESGHNASPKKKKDEPPTGVGEGWGFFFRYLQKGVSFTGSVCGIVVFKKGILQRFTDIWIVTTLLWY
jgi:hypothetical protein